jgi:hypothetical protein
MHVAAGTCAWFVPGIGHRLIVSSPEGAVRIDADFDLGARSTSFGLVVFLLFLSLVTRVALVRPSLFGADVAAVLLVLVASFVTPLWIVLFLGKAFFGAVVLAFVALRRAWPRPMMRAMLLAALVLVVVAVATFDLGRLARINTAFNEGAIGLDPISTTQPANTTDLVLGASLVNGAALAKGAYREGALDAALGRACGNEERRFARWALDGANTCFSLASWRAAQEALPALRTRIGFVGLNDDMTVPTSAKGAWLGSIMGILPNPDREQKTHTAWAQAAAVNLDESRRGELSRCLRELVASHEAPLTEVYELATFDLGHARAFGREAWVDVRRAIVEDGGGRFVDMRTLLPGESPLYFNDFSHLSALGYEAVAKGLCALDAGGDDVEVEGPPVR